MNKFTIYLSILCAFTLLTGCSTDDDSSSSQDINQKIIGNWAPEPLNAFSSDSLNYYKRFTYRNDGKVEYYIYSVDNEPYLAEVGNWVLDGDILTMNFPETVNLIFVQKVKFINDNLLNFSEVTDSDEDGYFGNYVRLGSDGEVEDEQEPKGDPYIVEFETGELEGYVSVGLTINLLFQNGTKNTIDPSFDRDQYEVSAEIPRNTSKFQLEFYIEDGSEAKMTFYDSENDEIIHQETVNQKDFEYQYSF